MSDQNSINQNIEECIRKISDLCGKSDNVMSAILEFDDDSSKIYEKQKELLIRNLCKITRENLEIPDVELFHKMLPDKDFWKSIKQIVERRTKNYLNAVPFNHLEAEERIDLLKRCFELIFTERENSEYVIGQFNNAELGKTLYGIIMESEYAIVTLYVSKRRFVMGMAESYGLMTNDAEYIWDEFQTHSDIVERHEFHRRIFFLNRKADELTNMVSELQDEFDDLISVLVDDEE